MTAPRLIVLAGLPGAGKTTIATWLSETHGFTIASRDTIRAAMFPRCRFTADEKLAAYTAMKSAIATMLSQSLDVVTDGMCFSSSAQLQEVIGIGRGGGAIVDVVECRCPLELAQHRVENDLADDPTVPADRDGALVRAVFERFERLPDEAHVVDTSLTLESIRSQFAAVLGLRDIR